MLLGQTPAICRCCLLRVILRVVGSAPCAARSQGRAAKSCTRFHACVLRPPAALHRTSRAARHGPCQERRSSRPWSSAVAAAAVVLTGAVAVAEVKVTRRHPLGGQRGPRGRRAETAANAARPCRVQLCGVWIAASNDHGVVRALVNAIADVNQQAIRRAGALSRQLLAPMVHVYVHVYFVFDVGIGLIV